MFFNYTGWRFSIVPLNYYDPYLIVTAQGGICLVLERKCCLYKQTKNGLRHGEEGKDSKAEPLKWERASQDWLSWENTLDGSSGCSFF